jgi:transcriptional regulator with XRE-family HTH domain
MKVKSSKPARSIFGRALRQARNAQALPQEAFDQTSSRTYVSAIERGLKHPTLTKIDDLAAVLHLHPLTLLSLAYCDVEDEASMEQLFGAVRREAADLRSALRSRTVDLH